MKLRADSFTGQKISVKVENREQFCDRKKVEGEAITVVYIWEYSV
jgi:hypothetical protein